MLTFILGCRQNTVRCVSVAAVFADIRVSFAVRCASIMHMKARTLLLSAVVACVTASSAPIVSVTDGTASASFVPGQSLTTPSGGPWSNITFNFISTAGLPTAAGSLYLLTQEFLGAPNQLSTSLPGFVATSQSAGGLYTFDPSLTIVGSTLYFVYANTSLLLTGSAVGSYPGGDLYSTIMAGSNFSRNAASDANFLLAGTPVSTIVPESGSLYADGAWVSGVLYDLREATLHLTLAFTLSSPHPQLPPRLNKLLNRNRHGQLVAL